MERLSPEDIRDIHDVALERYGGVAGENEPGLIDFMADKPFDGFGDVEYYPGLFRKAAVYFESFATHQLFVDGNKRTGYLCASVFLQLNGYILSISDDELYDVALKVANKQLNLDEIEIWLEENSIRYK